MRSRLLVLSLCLGTALSLSAQTTSSPDTNSSQDAAQQPQSTSSQATSQQQVQPMDKMPVYRVNVVQRTTKAVNYRHRGGSTKVDFRGTDLMPRAEGDAKVDGKAGRLEIKANFKNMQSARTFGPEYLTYVLWAITPEGRPVNLGEVLLDNNKAWTTVTTDLQNFGMIVTAEPYFAVTRPSNLVVLENIVRADTAANDYPIDAKFDLLEKGAYTVDVPASQLPATRADAKVPLELLQARNAVAIAKASGANQYAPDALAKAQKLLDQGEIYLEQHQARTPIGTVARAAAQSAEDARLLTIRRKQEEALANERRAAQEREDTAKRQTQEARDRAEQARLRADQEAQQRAQAEQERAAAEQAKAEADRARAEAQAAAEQARLEQQRAEQARQEAVAQQQQLALQAQTSEQNAQRAEQEREQMRQRLLTQLNQVLQTKDSARGLIVNMSDVLFDTGKATLKPGARERLARVSGIVLAYPDLHLEVDGHTDNVGGDAYNMKLSEARANAVEQYLAKQGVPMVNLTARGFGKTEPVASNATAAGRQQNRRVELVVSGEAIGTAVGPAFKVNGQQNGTTTSNSNMTNTTGTTGNINGTAPTGGLSGTATGNTGTVNGTTGGVGATGTVNTPAATGSGTISAPAQPRTTTTPPPSGTTAPNPPPPSTNQTTPQPPPPGA
jgi:outer membrane protein OmpA-like peptidoglycan-associated protein